MRDIRNKNNKGQRHGYQEIYWSNDKLGYKCFYNNGKLIDYDEFYYSNGELKKSFYI